MLQTDGACPGGPGLISPVRRIARLATEERLCAMTFSDGPCALPARPDNYRGKALTLVLAETLERFSARGTFLVVGDTSGNYPDRPGRPGTRGWNGKVYDHFPAYERDGQGGAVNCGELISRLLAGGHELAGCSYAHVPYGRVPRGKRGHIRDLERVLRDLERLHHVLKDEWDFSLRLARPPQESAYLPGGFDCCDAFALMGYQYLSGSFPGEGCRPLRSYGAEVASAWRPMERLLLEDPDGMRGQIVSARDGFDPWGRSPAAEALEKQLTLLTDLGYRVVTASELIARAPFADEGPRTDVGRAAKDLLRRGWCPACRDNTIRKDAALRRGDLAMMAFGWETVRRRVALIRSGKAPFRDMGPRHPYAAAAERAAATGAMTADGGRFRPDQAVTVFDLQRFCDVRLGRSVFPAKESFTRGEAILLLDSLLEKQTEDT